MMSVVPARRAAPVAAGYPIRLRSGEALSKIKSVNI